MGTNGSPPLPGPQRPPDISINTRPLLTLPFFSHPASLQVMVSLHLRFLLCHHTQTAGTLYSPWNCSTDDWSVAIVQPSLLADTQEAMTYDEFRAVIPRASRKGH